MVGHQLRNPLAPIRTAIEVMRLRGSQNEHERSIEDDDFHGPYNPTPGVGVQDIYFQCIDLVLTSTGEVSEEPKPRQSGCASVSASWLVLALCALGINKRRSFCHQSASGRI